MSKKKYADDTTASGQNVPGSAVQTMKLNYYPETDSLYIDLVEIHKLTVSKLPATVETIAG